MSVSVVIATKDRATFIERTLASLYASSVLPEAVVVADSSRDQDTRRLVEDWQRRWPATLLAHLACLVAFTRLTALVLEGGLAASPTAAGTPEKVAAEGAAPIVVIGTTRDPATPYEWSVRLRDQLADAALITYDGDGHTAYTRSNKCVDGAVDAYYLEGTMPEDGRGKVADEGHHHSRGEVGGEHEDRIRPAG